MKKIVSLCSIVILIFALIILSTACGKQKVDKIKLCEVTHSIFYAPQYVAINNGYFKEQDIEIELTNGGGADKVMTAVLSNQADIGFMGPEASIYVYNEGKEDHPVVFAQLTQKDGSFLVGREPEPDFEWENLKDKTIIGGRKGGVPEMTLEFVLKNYGLVPGENVEVLTNVQFNLMAGAFTGGTEDYVTLFEPTASMIEMEGSGYIVASVGAAAGNVPYTAYTAKKSYINKNKDLITRFTKGISKGLEYVHSHSAEEIAEIIKPSFPDSDIELLTKVVERYKQQDTWPSTPKMTEDSFNHLQDIIEMAGVLDKRAPFDDVVTNEFIK
jgi:NitT/TauT family transport system substrate-binding protein